MSAVARAALGAVLLAGAVLTGGRGAVAAPAQTTPVALNAVHIVLDISGSMADDDGTGRIKMEGAKAAVLQFLDGVSTGTAVGLRTYPDQGGASCTEGRLRYPVERHDPADIAAQVRSVQPDGDTPTAEALLRAADDIRQSGFPAATLILVSDGESTCGDPCAAAADIAGSGIDLDVIAVGFQISDIGREELNCISSTMGGRYIDSDDSDELEDIFEDLSVPRLSLTLDHPDEVVAEVGFESSGIVTVTAAVTNESQTQATNVQVRLAFETASPGVVAPVRSIGNLDASARSRVTWTFRPGLLLAGSRVEFVVVLRADNLPTDIGKTGSVLVLDPNDRGDAGAVLSSGPLAILGDSYSSGEGADDYLDGTDTAANSCHRSRLTYAATTFDIADNAILACSGAVAAHLSGPDYGNGVPSQAEQLEELQQTAGPVHAVLLSIGGNDVGFRQLAESCIIGSSCAESIHGEPSKEFIEREMATLPQQLLTAYSAVHAALNSAEAVDDRGAVAPIIVIGYPRPAPSVARACEGLALPLPVGDTSQRTVFDAAELTFVNEFITRLNGEIEGAVRAARTGPDRLPVFYVPFTEDSFLPDHTACDREPYARGLDSFNGAALEFNVSVGDFLKILVNPRAGVRALIARFGASVVDWVGRSIQELFHPNPDGYRAITRALIRWSLTSEATEIDDFLRRVPIPERAPSCPLDGAAPRTLTLGGAALGSLARCSIYEVIVTGYAPGTTVSVVVESSPVVVGQALADADGHAVIRFALPPDLTAGAHDVVVEGIDDAGTRVRIASPFRVDPPPGVLTPWIIAGGALALAIAAAVLWIVDRRRMRARTSAAPPTA